MNEYDNEVPVCDFYCFKNRSVWYVNRYSPKDFLEKCKWLTARRADSSCTPERGTWKATQARGGLMVDARIDSDAPGACLILSES